MDTTNKLPLDMVYHWEKAKANSVYDSAHRGRENGGVHLGPGGG